MSSNAVATPAGVSTGVSAGPSGSAKHVIDVDNDGEFVEDSRVCPFLPLSCDIIMCFMQWWRYVRRFGGLSMWPTQSRGAGIFDPYDTIPYFLTEEYNEFLSKYHMPDGGVVLNCGLTVPNVTYDTVSVRLTEFIQYVYGDPACDGFFTGNIPKSHDCWRDLVMLMAVHCTDDVCAGIFTFPDSVRALVTELARRINASALDRLQGTTVWCSQFADTQEEAGAAAAALDKGAMSEDMSEDDVMESDAEDADAANNSSRHRESSHSASPVSSPSPPCSP